MSLLGRAYSKKAEESVLATILSCPERFSHVFNVLSREHFAGTKTKELWEIICSSETTLSFQTILSVIEQQGKMHYFDEMFFSYDLPRQVVANETDFLAYVDVLSNAKKYRSILNLQDAINAAVDNDSNTINELISKIETACMSLVRDTNNTTCIDVSQTNVDELFSSQSFISSGYYSLDEHFYGLAQGDFIITAGRPGSGKSCLVMNIATYLSARQIPVAVFSLEMTSQQLLQRMICSLARVDLSMALTGKLNQAQQRDVDLAKEWLKGHSLYIDDDPILTPDKLKMKIIHLQSKYNIKAVFVDYLQLLRCPGHGNLYETVTEISKSLKSIASQTKLPIIVAAQLNRKSEDREHMEPRLGDLRDSGGIEQDADIVILIHRYGIHENPENGKSNIIIAKNRRGKLGKIPMLFIDKYTLFVEKDNTKNEINGDREWLLPRLVSTSSEGEVI